MMVPEGRTGSPYKGHTLCSLSSVQLPCPFPSPSILGADPKCSGFLSSADRVLYSKVCQKLSLYGTTCHPWLSRGGHDVFLGGS